jgi:4-diphosphocytidyl-2-C-methyl-D-erythritol kinase
MNEPRHLALPAPAKLNLFLHITGRREDGYHELQTVFQLLDYGDEVSFTRRDDDALTLTTSGLQDLADVAASDNLVLRAAHALRERAGRGRPGADIHLDKRLPLGGGLGGGSSDAASTLLGLNRLWELGLGVDDLAALSREIGADVPVFVRGHSAWGEGIGDVLEPVSLPERWYLVIHPGCHASTAELFSHPELTRDSPAITMSAFFAGPTRNDFEALLRRLSDPVDKSLNWLNKFGQARLTGSGACIFAPFETKSEADAVMEQVPPSWRAFVARGVNRSPTLDRLDRVSA